MVVAAEDNEVSHFMCEKRSKRSGTVTAVLRSAHRACARRRDSRRGSGLLDGGSSIGANMRDRGNPALYSPRPCLLRFVGTNSVRGPLWPTKSFVEEMGYSLFSSMI